MLARLQTWFARQSLTVKLLVALPPLALAVLWSATPGEPPRAADTGNRPVLAPAGQRTPAPGATTSTGAGSGGGGGSTAGQPAPPGTLLPHAEPQPVDTGLSWGYAFRTIASLGAVLALIILGSRALKQVMAASGQVPGGSAHLKVLETTYIPAPSGRGRSALHLIEAGERLLLVGATDAQLTLLAEFEGEDGRSSLRPRSARSELFGVSEQVSATALQPTSIAFDDILAEAAEKAPSGGGGRVTADRDSDLTDRLRRLRESAQRLEGAK